VVGWVVGWMGWVGGWVGGWVPVSTSNCGQPNQEPTPTNRPGAHVSVQLVEGDGSADWIVSVEASFLVPPGGDEGTLVVAIEEVEVMAEEQVRVCAVRAARDECAARDACAATSVSTAAHSRTIRD
jgi:hypothetical protein